MNDAPRFIVFVALWNLRQNMQTPHPHRAIAEWLSARYLAEDKKLLLMAFRACGKSTLTALFAAWLLLPAAGRHDDLFGHAAQL